MAGVSPATSEAEMGGPQIEASLGKTVSRDPISKNKLEVDGPQFKPQERQNKKQASRGWCGTAVIPAMMEAQEAGGPPTEASPTQKLETLSENQEKQRGLGCGSSGRALSWQV